MFIFIIGKLLFLVDFIILGIFMFCKKKSYFFGLAW